MSDLCEEAWEEERSQNSRKRQEERKALRTMSQHARQTVLVRTNRKNTSEDEDLRSKKSKIDQHELNAGR